MKRSDFIKMYFLFYFTNRHSRESIFCKKCGCALCENTMKRSDFIKMNFILFYKSPQQSVNLTKKINLLFVKHLEAKRFKKNVFLFYFTNHHSRASIFCKKKWMPALQNHHEGKRFYKNVFFILFYRSPQQRVDFMQKKDGHRENHLT